MHKKFLQTLLIGLSLGVGIVAPTATQATKHNVEDDGPTAPHAAPSRQNPDLSLEERAMDVNPFFKEKGRQSILLDQLHQNSEALHYYHPAPYKCQACNDETVDLPPETWEKVYQKRHIKFLRDNLTLNEVALTTALQVLHGGDYSDRSMCSNLFCWCCKYSPSGVGRMMAAIGCGWYQELHPILTRVVRPVIKASVKFGLAAYSLYDAIQTPTHSQLSIVSAATFFTAGVAGVVSDAVSGYKYMKKDVGKIMSEREERLEFLRAKRKSVRAGKAQVVADEDLEAALETSGEEYYSSDE